MEIEEKVNYLSQAYENSMNTIKQADSKANISITIQSLLASIGLASSLLLGTFVKANSLEESKYYLKVLYFVIVGIFLLVSTLGIISSIIIYFPVVKPKEEKERNRKGYLFFKHINAYESSDAYSNATEEKLLEDMSKQTYAISNLANKKMCYVKIAILFLLSSVILCLIVLVLSGVITIITSNGG